MTVATGPGAAQYFGLVLILSLPFYALGVTGAALPFASALPLSAMMAIVPTVAAFILIQRHGALDGIRAFLTTTFDSSSATGTGWVIATTFMPLAYVLTAAMVWLSGAPSPEPQLLPVSAVIPAFALFFIGAVGEELGWQGYAFPALTKHRSALTAALVIGGAWALWHVIPFALMGHSAEWIVWHSLVIILMRVIIVCLFLNTGRCVPITVLFHLMSNSGWGLFTDFDPYYDPQIMCFVLLTLTAAGSLLWMPLEKIQRRQGMFAFLIVLVGAVAALVIRTGLPMREPELSDSVLIGAKNEFAIDTVRQDLFSGPAPRVVPFQMLYPAASPGTPALYVPDAEPVIAALADSHGWIFHVLLGRIGTLAAPWTDAAAPAAGGPFPVIIALPGVTGYMQMGSFQTTALATQGFVVVTLNQPGAVAAAVLPDRRIVMGLTREDAVSLIAPSYLASDQALPDDFARKLVPESSIVPYFAADVTLVLDRLAEINVDPQHILYGLLDLDRIGVMGLSLGAIVTAQACASDARIGACLMIDAPVPTEVAARGLRQPALWISRPPDDQRLERTASGGWPDNEIAAQEGTIVEALSNSERGRLAVVHGLFHIDFTDLPAIQPVLGWLGQTGQVGVVEAHRQINELTREFFANAMGRAQD